jgi:hypothetical protein
VKVKPSFLAIAADMAAYPTIGPQPISTARPESSFVIAVGLNCTTLQADAAADIGLMENSVQS